jgi:predicted RND superfamily exporter protein
VIITLVMIVSLRSIRLAMIAMIPNVTPVALVFGSLGWTGTPVDIGTMMTASIALGIAVDGTFHFLVHYQRRLRRHPDRTRATTWALMQTGAPIFSAAIVASIGMLALTLSSFTPTANFGTFMALLLIAAVFGDLCLLPAILSFGRRKRPNQDVRAVRFPDAPPSVDYRKTA